MMISIYALHLDDGEYRYIGRTVRLPELRLKQHLKDAKKGHLPVRDWINKHQGNVHMTVIAIYDSFEIAQEMEQYWITAARLNYDKLLNCTDGGEGISGLVHSDESRAKMSASHMGNNGCLGRVLSDETKAKMSAAAIGRPAAFKGKHHTDESKALLSASRLGYKHTDEAKAKMRVNHLPHSEEHKRNLSIARHKRWHVNREIIKDGCEWCDQPADL